MKVRRFEIALRLMLVIALWVSACQTGGTVKTVTDTPQPGAEISDTVESVFYARVINNTRFSVIIENEKIEAGKTEKVPLSIYNNELTSGFDILYEIPLGDSLSLRCKGDNQKIRKEQEEVVINPPLIKEAYGVYAIITNRARNAVVFVSGNGRMPLLEQRGTIVRTGSRYEFSPNETAVYDISHDYAKDQYIIQDGGKKIPVHFLNVSGNWVYSFVYDGVTVTLVDERPLRRTGESSWTKTSAETKTMAEADGLVWPAPGNETISVFVPTAQGLFRHDYDSAGSGGAPVKAGERFEIAFAGRAGNGFMLAGYAQTGSNFRSIALIQGEDGAAREEFAPSTRRDRYSAYYLAAAAGDIDGGGGTWLLAGGADSGLNRPDGYRPYLRLVRRESGGLSPAWELGGDEFTAQPSGKQCGPATAAAYDSTHDRWLVAGNTLEWDVYGNSLGNSWLAIISATGTIQKIDLSFKGMTINKIITGPGGAYYLAGEERRGNESRACCVKYASTGAELWRLAAQPPPHSYVQDAFLDGEQQRLVLAGTLRAADPSGQGGLPFTLGLDPESGSLLWREELTGPALNGTAVVTAIAPAPDYGYILSLAGAADGNFARPFGIARINSRGKLAMLNER